MNTMIRHRSPSLPRRRSARSRVARLFLASLASFVTLVLATPGQAHAGTDARLERMALCGDSWLDWKNDAGRQLQFVNHVEGGYQAVGRGPAFAPKAPTTMFGLPVEQVFPQSVGMALGVSVLVRADLATTKRAFEKELGRPMSCKAESDGTGCELKLGEKKTAVLMADDPKQKQTLMGCFYYYEK